MKEPDYTQFSGGEYLVADLLEANLDAWLVGNPGVSKTLIALEISARLTAGKMHGDMKDPVNVVYVSVESGFNRSVGPRFKAAQGIWARFEHIKEVIWLPGKNDAGIKRLRKLITDYSPKLLIIDPIKDHFEPGVYSSPTKTAQVLAAIRTLAEEKSCTILCVDWPSKSAKKGDLSNSGNAAFTGKPRQILQVGRLSTEEWVIGTSKVSDGTPFTGWIYGVEGKDTGLIDQKTSRPIIAPAIHWIRVAKPAEVAKARQQADLEEDPNLPELLAFMAPGGDGTVTEFKTKDLLNWLKNSLMIGDKKGRSLLKACHSAGYLTQTVGGQAEDYAVTWKITDVGVLKLEADEETVEGLMEKLFPSMDPEPLSKRKSLPSPPTTPQTGT